MSFFDTFLISLGGMLILLRDIIVAMVVVVAVGSAVISFLGYVSTLTVMVGGVMGVLVMFLCYISTYAFDDWVQYGHRRGR